jgi:hypothetical protein
MPDASMEKVLGLPIHVDDFILDILLFDPILDVLEPIEMSEEELSQDSFVNEIKF